MKDMLYEGKSKVLYTGPEPGSLLIYYKDTATALNGEKKAELDGKGVLNAQISNYLYEYLAENGIKTHLLRIVDEKTVLVKSAEIIMVEVIVRNIAAGSFSKRYGVAEGSALLNTVVEFSLKSDELGDPLICESHITALGLATKEELQTLTDLALRINALLSDLFAKAGITLVDFKLEFGRVDGEILLCDEISPDSCRLWDQATGDKLDKDRFRRDLGDVLGGYRKVLAGLTHTSKE